MQTIIDITDDIYAELTKTGENEINLGILLALREAVRQGTPLPKGHGRLIDADSMWNAYHDLDYDFYEALDSVDTIIEADKEQES